MNVWLEAWSADIGYFSICSYQNGLIISILGLIVWHGVSSFQWTMYMERVVANHAVKVCLIITSSSIKTYGVEEIHLCRTHKIPSLENTTTS